MTVTDRDLTAAHAVQAAVAHVGLRPERVCIHTPRIPGCPPCTEVALRLALDAVVDVRADYGT